MHIVLSLFLLFVCLLGEIHPHGLSVNLVRTFMVPRLGLGNMKIYIVIEIYQHIVLDLDFTGKYREIHSRLKVSEVRNKVT